MVIAMSRHDQADYQFRKNRIYLERVFVMPAPAPARI